MMGRQLRRLLLPAFLMQVSLALSSPAFANVPDLRYEGPVQTDGTDVAVPGYSVPSFSDWNNDGLNDLIVGQGGGGSSEARVRVYLNRGAAGEPEFSDYFYAETAGGQPVSYLGTTCVPCACLGLFPRVLHWDGDLKKDLLVGQPDGRVALFLNVGTQAEPLFDNGSILQYGQPDSKSDISVNARATPSMVDWDEDGDLDMVVGAFDARIAVYNNVAGAGNAPDFDFRSFAQEDGSDLYVPGMRSSPDVRDLDRDGKKDILSGNTDGQLVFYSNTGSNASPGFSGYALAEDDGVLIDLPGWARSRPFVCNWNDDGLDDVLVGANDGEVHLYLQVVRIPGDANGDGVVDDLDLTALATHWQQPGGLEDGDFDCSGFVDDLDLTILALAWPGGPGPDVSGTRSGGDVSAVPEPATLSLLALLALSLPKGGALAASRRRR